MLEATDERLGSLGFGRAEVVLGLGCADNKQKGIRTSYIVWYFEACRGHGECLRTNYWPARDGILRPFVQQVLFWLLGW